LSRVDFFLWVVIPYVCITTFVVGHVWRYRRDQYGCTARSTQLFERGLLRVGSLLFHFGMLFVIGGHVLGILVSRSWTQAVGVPQETYHWVAVLLGSASGLAVFAGFAILVARRGIVARVRATILRSDLLLYPLFAVVIVTGMLATLWGSAADRYEYRETISPWFRGLFLFQPNEQLMANAPFIFQAHAVTALLLFAVWPFTRLVHVWSVPIAYVGRSPILYRRRSGQPSLDEGAAYSGRISGHS
jgi:nitrate reductase gamma subunit